MKAWLSKRVLTTFKNGLASRLSLNTTATKKRVRQAKKLRKNIFQMLKLKKMASVTLKLLLSSSMISSKTQQLTLPSLQDSTSISTS